MLSGKQFITLAQFRNFPSRLLSFIIKFLVQIILCSSYYLVIMFFPDVSRIECWRVISVKAFLVSVYWSKRLNFRQISLFLVFSNFKWARDIWKTIVYLGAVKQFPSALFSSWAARREIFFLDLHFRWLTVRLAKR